MGQRHAIISEPNKNAAETAARFRFIESIRHMIEIDPEAMLRMLESFRLIALASISVGALDTIQPLDPNQK